MREGEFCFNDLVESRGLNSPRYLTPGPFPKGKGSSVFNDVKESRGLARATE